MSSEIGRTPERERYQDLAAYVGLVLSAVSTLGAAQQVCVLRAALEILEARKTDSQQI